MSNTGHLSSKFNTIPSEEMLVFDLLVKIIHLETPPITHHSSFCNLYIMCVYIYTQIHKQHWDDISFDFQ